MICVQGSGRVRVGPAVAWFRARAGNWEFGLRSVVCGYQHFIDLRSHHSPQ